MNQLTALGNILGTSPVTAGRSFWVAPSASYTVNGTPFAASDGNSGQTAGKALASVAQAQALATASAGDVIYLLPGTHTLTASLAASKAGVTYVGLPYWPQVGLPAVRSMRPMATLTTSAADEAVNVTAADCTFLNLRFLPVTQQKALDYTTAAHRLRLIDCLIDLTAAVAHANTRGVFATSTAQAPADVVIRGCVLKEANAGTSNGAALDLGAALNFLVANCHIYKEYTASSAAWTAAIVVNDGVTGTFSDNRFLATGGGAGDAISAGVLGATLTLAGMVQFERNITSVNVTKMASTFAAADVHLVLNYIATVAGGTGGTLITASA